MCLPAGLPQLSWTSLDGATYRLLVGYLSVAVCPNTTRGKSLNWETSAHPATPGRCQWPGCPCCFGLQLSGIPVRWRRTPWHPRVLVTQTVKRRRWRCNTPSETELSNSLSNTVPLCLLFYLFFLFFWHFFHFWLCYVPLVPDLCSLVCPGLCRLPQCYNCPCFSWSFHLYCLSLFLKQDLAFVFDPMLLGFLCHAIVLC